MQKMKKSRKNAAIAFNAHLSGYNSVLKILVRCFTHNARWRRGPDPVIRGNGPRPILSFSPDGVALPGRLTMTMTPVSISRGSSLGGLLQSGFVAAGVSDNVSRGLVHCLLSEKIDPDILSELDNLEIVIDEEEPPAGPPPPAVP